MTDCGPNGCPDGRGKRLTAVDIGVLLIHSHPNGLDGDRLRKAATRGIAVALAESGGYPGACNSYVDAKGDRHYVYGLWQISDVHGTGKTPCDPATAATLFWQLSANGTNWAPWASSIGMTTANMPIAVAAYTKAARVIVGEAGNVLANIPNPLPHHLDFLKTWGDAIIFLVKFFTSPNTWLRVGETIAGAVLLLFGLWVLFSQTKAGSSVNRAASSAAVAAA